MPSVKVEIRTVEEMERMEGKTYRELTLMCHLPNFKRINPNANEQTRTMAAYMYCVLYKTDHRHKSITDRLRHGLQMPNDTIQKTDNRKRQPSRPGRLSEARGGSRQKLEEVAEMEGAPPAKRTRKTTKSATAAKATPKVEREKHVVRRSSKPSEQIGRTVRFRHKIRRLSKILNVARQDQIWRADDFPLYIVYIRSVLFQKFQLVQ